jgi:uncharacterized membrane protein
MSVENVTQKRIEQYLDAVQAFLRGVKEQDVQEFVKELRSHIQEKTSTLGETKDGGLETVLMALGDPKELANEYKANALITKVKASESPVRILEALFRWAGFSVTGLFVLVGAIAGYFFGGVLLLCAGLKLFHPQTVGLWALHDGTGDLVLSFRLGSTSAPAGAHELLGWWILPIGLLVAFGLVVSTSHLALWCAKRFRRLNVFISLFRGKD